MVVDGEAAPPECLPYLRKDRLRCRVCDAICPALGTQESSAWRGEESKRGLATRTRGRRDTQCLRYVPCHGMKDSPEREKLRPKLRSYTASRRAKVAGTASMFPPGAAMVCRILSERRRTEELRSRSEMIGGCGCRTIHSGTTTVVPYTRGLRLPQIPRMTCPGNVGLTLTGDTRRGMHIH